MAIVLIKSLLSAAGIRFPALGFGGAGLGNLYREVSDEAAVETLDAAWGHGIRYFDTAPYYGFGLSEARLGAYLRSRDRNSFVLSTKVGRLLLPAHHIKDASERHGFCSPMPFEPAYDYSHDGVLRSFESSLERLDLERIDMLLLHDVGERTHGANHPAVFAEAMDGGYRALAKLRDEGLVRAIGIGANEWEVCNQALDRGDFDCFLLAGRYTLLEQGALDGFLPRCLNRGVAVIIGGPYNSGILATGVLGNGQSRYDYAPAPDAVIKRVASIEGFCREFAVPLPAAALQFPLAHPAVASAIPGLTSGEDVRQALAYCQHPIPDAFWQALRNAGLMHPRAPLPSQQGAAA